MNKLIYFKTLILTTAASGALYAGETNQPLYHGTKGGGEVVDIDSRPVLKDLRDKSNCSWKTLSAFAESVPELKVVNEKVKAVSWPLYQGFLQDTGTLKVCETEGDLIQLDSDDLDKVVVFVLNGKQVAIRVNDMIFVSMPIYRKMSGLNRAYLLIHEMMHSFIPMDTPQRIQKVKSMTAKIEELVSKGMDEKEFALQIEMNKVSRLTKIKRKVFDTIMDEKETLLLRGIMAEYLLNRQHLVQSMTKYELDAFIAVSIKHRIAAIDSARRKMKPLTEALESKKRKEAFQFLRDNRGNIKASDILNAPLNMKKVLGPQAVFTSLTLRGTKHYDESTLSLYKINGFLDDSAIYVGSVAGNTHQDSAKKFLSESYLNVLDYAVFSASEELVEELLMIEGLADYLRDTSQDLLPEIADIIISKEPKLKPFIERGKFLLYFPGMNANGCLGFSEDPTLDRSGNHIDEWKSLVNIYFYNCLRRNDKSGRFIKIAKKITQYLARNKDLSFSGGDER